MDCVSHFLKQDPNTALCVALVRSVIYIYIICTPIWPRRHCLVYKGISSFLGLRGVGWGPWTKYSSFALRVLIQNSGTTEKCVHPFSEKMSVIKDTAFFSLAHFVLSRRKHFTQFWPVFFTTCICSRNIRWPVASAGRSIYSPWSYLWPWNNLATKSKPFPETLALKNTSIE